MAPKKRTSKAAASVSDLDQQQAANRARNAANKLSVFCLKWDWYLLPAAALYILYYVHIEPTANAGLDGYKKQAFNVADWFSNVTSVPIVLALFCLVWGFDDLKVDSDKLSLLWVLCISCFGAGVMATVAVFKTGPVGILAVACCFAFAYLHFKAATAFICGPPRFTTSSAAVPKTEAVIVRIALLADVGVLGGIAAVRVIDGLTSGNVLSMPIAMLATVALVALTSLRASASGCVHQLRHVLTANVMVYLGLFFSAAQFIPDWTTQTVRMVAMVGLAVHSLCFVTDPILRVLVNKWLRFKRFLTNFSPGEALATE